MAPVRQKKKCVNRNDSKRNNALFGEMKPEDAKKEYERLMNLYLLNDMTGDLDKTIEVITAYDQYCKGC